MRIPTSVIVMSLLTAAPFGLAIRETLNKQDANADQDVRDQKRRQALEEYEREAEREAELRSHEREQRIARLDTIYGATPASMGSLLDGIVLRADAGSFQSDAARVRIEHATRDRYLKVAFDVDATALRAVRIAIDDACETVRDKLVAAWSPSTHGTTWLDPATHQRAHLDTETCTLVFERYFEPNPWVAALPLDAVGQPSQRLIDRLGSAGESNEDGAIWSVPGVGLGHDDTTLEAFFANGKVTGFQASAVSDFDSVVAIRRELAATLKAQPTRGEDGGPWQWKRKVPVSIYESSPDRFTVVVGTIPWQ